MYFEDIEAMDWSNAWRRAIEEGTVAQLAPWWFSFCSDVAVTPFEEGAYDGDEQDT